MSGTFLVTALVVVLLPGSGTLYTLAAAIARGPRAGILAAFGSTLGIVPHLLAAVTGLAAVLNASAVAYDAAKYAGVAYLLYLAWSTWRDTGALQLSGAPAHASAASVIINGIAINLLNPKLTVFFVTLLPQFVPAGSPASLLQMLVLSAVFMAMTFTTFAGYALVAGAVRERVLSSERVMRTVRRAFGVCFAGLALRLATEHR